MSGEPSAQELLDEAIAADADAYQALFAGRMADAHASLESAAALYRASWEAAPPRGFGRLVAFLKSATLAGEGEDAARYVRERLDDVCDSPTSCYALAVAALIEEDDDLAAVAAARMREGGDAFARAGLALGALAAGDGGAYAAAVTAIVRDFEGRSAHLTGLAVADTAMLMEALAADRGLAVRPRSEVLPDRP